MEISTKLAQKYIPRNFSALAQQQRAAYNEVGDKYDKYQTADTQTIHNPNKNSTKQKQAIVNSFDNNLFGNMDINFKYV